MTILRIAIALLAICTMPACAKRPRPSSPSPPMHMHAIIPLPASVEIGSSGPFVVTPATTIRVSSGDERTLRIARYLSDLIGLAAGSEAPKVETPKVETPADVLQPGRIHLALGGKGGPEAYELAVTADRVLVTAADHAGLFYGVQTLRQLLPPSLEHEAVRADKSRQVSALAVRVSDRPRFAWRGAMLDVARHFLTVDELKRYIDLMALYKLNRLHLHLADDQGWRIAIGSWPNLTRHGGSTEVGSGAGGFYTQEEYSDIVRYAEDRFITVVPEIDMPGHTNAALASYAELNCDGVARSLYTGIEVGFSALCVEKDVTYQFIDDVVREIAAISPGPYFHIGGDEVKTLSAKQYTQFVERVQRIVQKHGKQMVGWDEIAPAALDPTTIVQHWRPRETPPIAKGISVIMSPANKAYLDMKYDAETTLGLDWAGYVDIATAYSWDPATLLEGVPETSIAGVEAPLWSETLGNIRDVEMMAFPRLPAIAEVGWSPADQRHWDEFKLRLGRQAPRWSALGLNFHRCPEVPWEDRK